MTKLSNTFTRNIDELLAHCASVDDFTIDQAVELEMAIQHVMKEMEVDRDTAIEVIQEIHLNEVQRTVDTMVAKGLIEITGYNKNNEPLYSLTELGKSLPSSDA